MGVTKQCSHEVEVKLSTLKSGEGRGQFGTIDGMEWLSVSEVWG